MMSDLQYQQNGQGLPTLTEHTARAGSARELGADTKVSELDITAALRTVYDPEIPVNIYELGLIYEIKVTDNGDINITMSLTAPGCPVAGEMPQMVADAVAAVDGVGEVEVCLVWDPPWTPERMTADARLALGMD